MTRGERARYLVKAALSYALYYTGILQVFQRLALRHRAVVLMYHRVLTAEERARTASHPALVVDRDTFAKQMALLKRRFTVLSLVEFTERMERRIPFPDSSCLITFDDGWRDNYSNAFPILKTHGLPALVFIPVNYIGTRRLFWQEALTHLLRQVVRDGRAEVGRRSRFRDALRPFGLDPLLDLPTQEDPRPAIIQAVGSQKALPVTEIERLIRLLCKVLNVKLEDYADVDGFVTWQQVAEMAHQGIAFGGHGAEHRLLTQVSREEARQEIGNARRVLNSRPGAKSRPSATPMAM